MFTPATFQLTCAKCHHSETGSPKIHCERCKKAHTNWNLQQEMKWWGYRLQSTNEQVKILEKRVLHEAVPRIAKMERLLEQEKNEKRFLLLENETLREDLNEAQAALAKAGAPPTHSKFGKGSKHETAKTQLATQFSELQQALERAHRESAERERIQRQLDHTQARLAEVEALKADAERRAEAAERKPHSNGTGDSSEWVEQILSAKDKAQKEAMAEARGRERAEKKLEECRAELALLKSKSTGFPIGTDNGSQPPPQQYGPQFQHNNPWGPPQQGPPQQSPPQGPNGWQAPNSPNWNPSGPYGPSPYGNYAPPQGSYGGGPQSWPNTNAPHPYGQQQQYPQQQYPQQQYPPYAPPYGQVPPQSNQPYAAPQIPPQNPPSTPPANR